MHKHRKPFPLHPLAGGWRRVDDAAVAASRCAVETPRAAHAKESHMFIGKGEDQTLHMAVSSATPHLSCSQQGHRTRSASAVAI